MGLGVVGWFSGLDNMGPAICGSRRYCPPPEDFEVGGEKAFYVSYQLSAMSYEEERWASEGIWVGGDGA
jgi:hypothetical protein